ncbi:hypothetical protein C8Q79DRAFT_597226 [Trametes meyenii]|nr:hypothetical protein C8Q79DRAFT_597226 [Trametes meyenii]
MRFSTDLCESLRSSALILTCHGWRRLRAPSVMPRARKSASGTGSISSCGGRALGRSWASEAMLWEAPDTRVSDIERGLLCASTDASAFVGADDSNYRGSRNIEHLHDAQRTLSDAHRLLLHRSRDHPRPGSGSRTSDDTSDLVPIPGQRTAGAIRGEFSIPSPNWHARLSVVVAPAPSRWKMFGSSVPGHTRVVADLPR